METTFVLFGRQEQKNASSSQLTMDLVITLLVLASMSLLLVGALFWLRRVRRLKQQPTLPFHNAGQLAPGKPSHRRVPSGFTISAFKRQSKQDLVIKEKPLSSPVSSSPPSSPLPEIRVTLPEEVGRDGKLTSGRVVVVHMGEKGIGMEPVDEPLPPYDNASSDRYQSIDLDRIGGLKEKSGYH